jgi:diguanylate cyclase (GGDEF)-like protein
VTARVKKSAKAAPAARNVAPTKGARATASKTAPKSTAPAKAAPKAITATQKVVSAAPKVVTATTKVVTATVKPVVVAAPKPAPVVKAAPVAVAPWVKNQRKAAMTLVDAMEERGLLAHDEIESLRVEAEDLASEGEAADALARVGNFQKKLAASLSPEGAEPTAAPGRGLETLFEINRQISRLIDPTECCERLLALVRQAIPNEGATLYLSDAEGTRLHVAATLGHETDLIDRIQFDGGTGFSGWVARTQKPILFGSLKRSQPTHEGVIKSFMAAPLVVAGRTIGVLTLGHSTENAFNRDDLRMLVMVGTQAAALLTKVILEARIREVAITDELTGLYNTGHFLIRVQDESARAGRFLQEFAVVRVSMDDFGAFRESVGTEAADRAIVEVSSILRGLARGTDLVARTGASEFALLLPVTNRDEAEAAARRLAHGIENHVFPRRKRLTATTAAVTFPEDGTESQELLRSADNGLERARRRNRDEFADIPAVRAS